MGCFLVMDSDRDGAGCSPSFCYIRLGVHAWPRTEDCLGARCMKCQDWQDILLQTRRQRPREVIKLARVGGVVQGRPELDS